MTANDELWHVRISPDEVKTLTLEQIDDLYRLDVIDGDTQLWQDGMDEWLPLRVVAGLDEEEVVNISVPPTLPPPPASLGTTASWPPPVAATPAASWPPSVSARPSAPAPSTRPPVPSVRPPVPSVRPPVPSSRPAPPSSRAPALASTASSWPPAIGGASPVSTPPDPLALFSSPPASTQPFVAAESYNAPRPASLMPIVLAAVVGVVVTLYRNDVLHAAARTVGQESAYLRAEAALGGPGFGTLRAVEPMAKAAAALPNLPPPPVSTSTPYRDTSSSESRYSSSTSSGTTTQATATTRPEPPKAAPRAPVARPVARPAAEKPNAVFKQPKGAKKAKGSEFDPLNPNL